MYQNLILTHESGVATVQLNRPAKKNSLNSDLRFELEAVLKETARDKAVRVVVITGGEDFFCAGADIAEIQTACTAEEGYRHSREFQVLFDQIEVLPQPVVAAIAGYALGGGFELALACDFRIAAAGALLGLPEIKLGVLPGGGGTQRLPRLIGAGRAKEMIFTGVPITAEAAKGLGLVLKVVPQGKVTEEAKNFAATLVALPPLALAASKTAINRGLEADLASGLELEARCLGNLATSQDFQEGTRAFFEKRKPRFTGT